MTPLAHQLAKQLLLPPSKWSGMWKDRKNASRLLGALSEAQFFEVTAVLPLAEQFEAVTKKDVEQARELMGQFVFLPAPLTWIEFKFETVERIAIVLGQKSDEPKAVATLFWAEGMHIIGTTSLNSTTTEAIVARLPGPVPLVETYGERLPAILLPWAHFLLLMINSPHLLTSVEHKPHTGLKRDLTRALGPAMFPLKAWTEIRLEVTKPRTLDDGEPHQDRITGQRALHFCRKHVRVRNGRLEYVSAHWRGNPAKGIKRSRYRVTP